MMPSTISSSITPFFYPQSFPASGSFPVSWLFTSGGQSTGVSASVSVLPMDIQGWFPLGIIDLTSLLSVDRVQRNTVSNVIKMFLKPQHHMLKASILWCSAFFMVQLTHPNVTTRKTIALTRRTFVSKVMSLFFNMLSRFVMAFLPRNKHLLISRVQ